jgi:nitroreductase
MITQQDRLALVVAANRAPSVHNIQPTRFRFDDEQTITLLEDPSRRLYVGDPTGKDNQKSIGAALEGLILALSERGLGATLRPSDDGSIQLTLQSGAPTDQLAPFAESRASWRGVFERAARDGSPALDKLAEACPDLHIISAPDAVAELAHFYDKVSLEVLQDRSYRAELLSWMRLSRSDANYWRDGLNAEHMALSPLEAFGASVVLGGGFPLLNGIGVAGPLMAESAKVRSAACVALFHRPADEPELDTGRRFYRVWLEIERLGLCLCPMSVLGDVPHAATRLMNEASLPSTRKLVTAFRIGHRPANARKSPRARLPASELLVKT